MTVTPEIAGGNLTVPKGPGWGTAINEESAAPAHAWDPRKEAHTKQLAPAKSF